MSGETGPAFENTDDASTDVVLAAVLQCAASWEPNVRLLGNVRAGDIVRSLTEVLTKRLTIGSSGDEPIQIIIEHVREDDGSQTWLWSVFGFEKEIATGSQENLINCIDEMREYMRQYMRQYNGDSSL